MMAKNTAQKRIKVTDFQVRLAMLKAEAGQLGLYKTMHKLDAALKEVGFELADKVLKNINEYKGQIPAPPIAEAHGKV